MNTTTDALADITIQLFSQRAIGRWGFEIKGPHFLSRLGAGFRFSATTDTLQAFALVSALKQLSRSDRARFFLSRNEMRDGTEALPRKLRIKVQSTYPLFEQVFTDVRNAGRRRSRVAGELFRAVRRELNRFECSFEVIQKTDMERLRRFAKRVAYMPASIDGFPAPQIVATSE